MRNISNIERFSTSSLWEDLNRVLVKEVDRCKNSIPTYRSATGISCQTWMREIGEAIKSGDVKTAIQYLHGMAGYSQEAIFTTLKYQLKIPEEHDKPFQEFFMAAHLLMIKLTGRDFR